LPLRCALTIRGTPNSRYKAEKLGFFPAVSTLLLAFWQAGYAFSSENLARLDIQNQMGEEVGKDEVGLWV
jgi:hypothetical protein